MNRKIQLITIVIFVILLIIAVRANKAVEMNSINIYSHNLPTAFNGFKIVHVSDLHNAKFGEDNEKLFLLIQNSDADIIVITGDIMDSRRTDRGVSEEFVKKALELAPVYYVSGNHESRIEEYNIFRQNISSLGAYVLDDECAEIERNGEKINILGVIDPSFKSGVSFDDYEEASKLKAAIEEIKKEGYNILLSHRPEYFDVYAECGIDLVFSGHAHGGQFRLPFIGGLFAPGQGIFPKYDSGLYTKDKTNMIVSRGLGNSLFPLRINNDPEVILVTLWSVN